jgi:hypothetical protein
MKHIIVAYRPPRSSNHPNDFIESADDTDRDTFNMTLALPTSQPRFTLHYVTYSKRHKDSFDRTLDSHKDITQIVFQSIVDLTINLKASSEDILVLLHVGKTSNLSFVDYDLTRIDAKRIETFKGGDGPIYEKIVNTSGMFIFNIEEPEEQEKRLEEIWNSYDFAERAKNFLTYF